MADQSPFGWLTVNYKSNALAADEEDEKRLVKRRQAVKKGKSHMENNRSLVPAPNNGVIAQEL